MASGTFQSLTQYLRASAAVEQGGRLTDAELLERFVGGRDGAAFEVLVWRHGPMVLNVCRRVTRREEDAEDAFQATFYALARKAYAIGRGDAVGSWLYKVAYRAALEAKRRAPGPHAGAAAPKQVAAGPVEEALGRELETALDEELSRLPEKYRVPLVLCCLEGKTNRQIAEQLHCAEATVRTRLARARERLRKRLDRRGLAVSGSSLTAALAPGAGRAAPAGLFASTIEAALRLPSASVACATPAAVIAESVLKGMFLQMMWRAAAIAVLLGVLGGAAAFSAHSRPGGRAADEGKEGLAERAGTAADPAPEDRAALGGTWESVETVTRVVGGKPLPPEQQKVRWVITADRIIRTDADGFIDEEWTYGLDPASHPKGIDLRSRRLGAYPGTYRLQGEGLTICLGFDGKRPTEFPAKADACWVFRRISPEPAPVLQRFASAPGCFWMIEPSGPGTAMATLGITYLFEKAPDGAALITLAYALPEPGEEPWRELRPVLLDAKGKRHVPTDPPSGGYSSRRGGPRVVLQRWRMDPKVLPADRVVRLGVEAVTVEGTRLAAREAREQARKAGVEVLPWPEVGKEYPVTLTTIDGRKLGPADFRGKVVVIQCWAVWCSPCMAKMAELKRLYERWHEEGLEILGVSLDRDAATVRKVCKEQGLGWPQVLAPADGKGRVLWEQAAGIEAIPRVFLLDREGRLQADTPGNLEEAIGKLLKAR
jgi:RNA polymerase sigma factor (sigma-70 family)